MARNPDTRRPCPARHDAEIDRLKAEVHCGTVLERCRRPWRLDRRQSTAGALKYRRDPGEIVIVNHDGRGWWDPGDAHARGDVFGLVQRLEPGLNFGQVRCVLRQLAGVAPASPPAPRSDSTEPAAPVAERWRARPPLTEGSGAWRYLAGSRGLPPRVLELAVRCDLIREGPGGSAWFAHRDHAGRLTGIEMRGPRWRGFSARSAKSLFRLPGSAAPPSRLAVVEAPIDALSLAAIEGPRRDTLHLATAGGMGPGTVMALNLLLAELATRPGGLLVAAGDADPAGERQAELLDALAAAAGVPSARLRPWDGHKDWNDVVRARRQPA